MNTISQYIFDYFEENKLMQIASANKQKPWIATVWFSFQKNFQLYFMSKHYRRHSEEISHNSSVACAIVKPHSKGFGQKVQGVHLEGNAYEVQSKDLEVAYENYSDRFPKARNHLNLENLKKGVSNDRLFTVIPTKIIWFDEINFPKEPQQIYLLT